MNARKPIAFAAAMLITAANLYGIATYTSAATGAMNTTDRATTEVIQTLPTINVHPTREQLQEVLHGGSEPTSSIATPVGNTSMPYYSFAADTAAGA
ncbi:MAG: hypothetical protein ACREPY_04895 [Rhodanobacteraceae bacterium]